MTRRSGQRVGPAHRVLETWKAMVLRQGIIPHGARIMVGVSGGADSVSLVHLLYALRHELALQVTVAHYDHALRPGSSSDCSFVRKISASLGLNCVWERNAVRKPAGMSVEDFARQRRFDFFTRMARAHSVDAVALAHTKDDLAETVLMRILRGTGLAGLRAMLPRRVINGTVFLRPMLEMTRAQVEAFLVEEGLAHREDPTNAGDDFLRNRVRHRLIPYIAREFTPSVIDKLAELALNAASDYAFLEEELMKVLPQVVRIRAGKVMIARASWSAFSAAMRRMILREGMARLTGTPAGALACRHVDALERAGLEGARTVLSLPAGHRAVITDKFISLS